MKCHDTILELVGGTPLVRLRKVVPAERPLVLAKVESFNPGGSVKDRIGVHLIEKAERAGLLRPGGTIVEATSGNTGAGLAVAAAVKGYRCVFTIPDKMSREKINLLKAYGARVVVTPTAVPPDSPESHYEVAKRIARETPGAFLANQYFNADNPEAHYETTGPEIWNATDGKVTHLVASIGTGGTISGTGRYLKEKNPSLKVIGADPVGSILAEYFRTRTMTQPHGYLVEGIGEDIIPGTLDFDVLDDVEKVTDQESFHLARRLSREEGILGGGSSGTAVAAALRIAARVGPDAVIVVILPDTGERYLSKVHSDEWMRDNGMLSPSEVRLGDLLRQKSRSVPALVTIPSSETLGRALELIREHDVSQVPVLHADGTVAGTILEGPLLAGLLEGKVRVEDPLERLLDTPLPRLGADEPVERGIRLLSARNSAFLVEEKGQVIGLLSRFDLIGFVAR